MRNCTRPHTVFCYGPELTFPSTFLFSDGMYDITSQGQSCGYSISGRKNFSTRILILDQFHYLRFCGALHCNGTSNSDFILNNSPLRDKSSKFSPCTDTTPTPPKSVDNIIPNNRLL